MNSLELRQATINTIVKVFKPKIKYLEILQILHLVVYKPSENNPHEIQIVTGRPDLIDLHFSELIAELPDVDFHIYIVPLQTITNVLIQEALNVDTRTTFPDPLGN